LESASPKRIIQKVQHLFEIRAHADPEVSIICRKSSLSLLSVLDGVKIYPVDSDVHEQIPEELSRKTFDVAYAFWTGEKKYRRMKRLALRLKAKSTRIVAGDGNEFKLTWKAMVRHAMFRFRHPLPTDHRNFVGTHEAGERILIIQSAEPAYVLEALDRLGDNRIFPKPHYTLFCRDIPEVRKRFENHPGLARIWPHAETRNSWGHLRHLRRERFDCLVLFMTGDPSYRKVKVFAFMLGVPIRRILVFNETADCFFFNWKQWLSLISRHMQDRPRTGITVKPIHWARFPVALIIKAVLLPFRFLYLHLVWIRLRLSGIIGSRKNHDRSIQLPPFSGS
jgi:hypothetical protein